MFLDSVSNSCFYFGWQNKNCLLFKFEFQVKISNLIGVLLFCSLCCAVLSQPCLTLCGPINYIPPSCSLHGILQARILEWVAMPFLSPEGRFFTTSATWEALFLLCLGLKKYINSSPASDVSWLMNRRDIKVFRCPFGTGSSLNWRIRIFWGLGFKTNTPWVSEV